MRSTKAEQGIGIIGLLFFIVVIGVVGFVGWRLYTARTGAPDSFQCGVNTKTLKGGCIPATGEQPAP